MGKMNDLSDLPIEEALQHLASKDGLPDELHSLVETLRPYDVADLLASAAALQICAKNVNHSIRLDALTHAIASLPYEYGKPHISKHRLSQICNEPPLSKGTIERLEDPPEQSFTEAFTFIGGSYIVFPGTVEQATFVLRHLNEAIFFGPEPLAPEFMDLVKETDLAILLIGDFIAKKAGLGRNLPPIPSPDGRIFIPAHINDLKKAVVFTQNELEQILIHANLPLDALDPFTTQIGSVTITEYTVENGALQARPIVKVNDQLIVSQPGMLLASLRHRILCLAVQYNLSNQLALRYRSKIWQSTVEHLDYFRYKRVDLNLPIVEHSPLLDGVWAIDSDKCMHVILETDDFRDYQSEKVFGEWKTSGIPSLMDERQIEVEQFLLNNSRDLNEILVLYLYAGIGRTIVFGVDRPARSVSSLRLAMDAFAFITIALLEADDPLVLVKFANAVNDIRTTTKVLSWSQLDEFALYKDNKYSYYLSDKRRPELLSVSPNYHAGLILKTLERFDPHAVVSHQEGYITEVVSLHGVAHMPIYVPRAEIGATISILVEELPIPVWVVGPDDQDQLRKYNLFSQCAQFADMVAYWLWQFTPELAKHLSCMTIRKKPLIFRLDLELTNEWSRISDPSAQTSSPPVAYAIHPSNLEVIFQVKPEIQNIFASPDNSGERMFMEVVLRAIGDLLSALGYRAETLSLRSASQPIIERFAPIGAKKKLIILNLSNNPQLDTKMMSPYRKVQDADVSNVLDTLGKQLIQTMGLKEGTIPAGQRIEILREAVAFLYERLERLVATVRSDLLDYIILQNESVTQERASRELTVPTQLACFGSEKVLVEQLNEYLPEIAETGITCRFLVEYVAARPPHGVRPVSLSLYDELIALASQIIRLAQASDLIRHNIADIELSMLPSGRLGINQQVIVQANSLFIPLKSKAAIEHARGAFHRNWREVVSESPDTPDSFLKAVEEAFEAEFGLKLTWVTAALGELVDIGLEMTDLPIKKLSRGILIETMAKNLEWPLGRVEHVIDFLTLSSRPDFLSPPPPFQKEDVYPWRFSRPLAYIRRPLIRVIEGDADFYHWGIRHTHSAAAHIIDLCLGGRLQSRAQSKEMRDLIGRIHQMNGKAFVRNVADTLEVSKEVIVKTNVNKIGRLRIGRPGNDLGDIDVLVIAIRQRRVIAVECKDLAAARTPNEMSNELDELFRGSGKQTAVVTKHGRRCAWLQKNLEELLKTYGLSVKGQWRVEPLMVVNEEMFTSHLYSPPFPVYSLQTFMAEVASSLR